MKKDRKSMRLQGYDYSQAGFYFVTICIQNRMKLFGNIESGEMKLNQAGKMVDQWWLKLDEKFYINLDEYIIMPDHFHGIIQILGEDNLDTIINPLGNDPCVIADQSVGMSDIITNPLGDDPCVISIPDAIAINQGRHMGLPLTRMMQWFKTMTTNKYIKGVRKDNWQPFYKKLWQKSYYDHIIRNHIELNRIRNYIRNNPANY